MIDAENYGGISLRITKAKSGTEGCSTCVFSQYGNECRRYPPVEQEIHNSDRSTYFITKWPSLPYASWCGEWVRQP